jgi:hypothetical protein
MRRRHASSRRYDLAALPAVQPAAALETGVCPVQKGLLVTRDEAQSCPKGACDQAGMVIYFGTKRPRSRLFTTRFNEVSDRQLPECKA